MYHPGSPQCTFIGTQPFGLSTRDSPRLQPTDAAFCLYRDSVTLKFESSNQTCRSHNQLHGVSNRLSYFELCVLLPLSQYNAHWAVNILIFRFKCNVWHYLCSKHKQHLMHVTRTVPQNTRPFRVSVLWAGMAMWLLWEHTSIDCTVMIQFAISDSSLSMLESSVLVSNVAQHYWTQ